SDSFGLPRPAPTAGCQTSCKTSRPSINTDASLSGNTAQFRTTTRSTDFFYKSCPTVSGSPTCPLDPGETLVTDCRCQDDFAEAASLMEVLKSAGEGLTCDGTTDPNTGLCTGQIKIFEGTGASCRPPGAETTFFNCCSNGSSSILNFLKYCKASEKALNDARDQGRTREIGTRCIKKIPLIGCVQRERVYCAFSGKLGRIIQEQGRPQLNTFGPDGAWGRPGAPNCTGFSPEDFQMIDFSRIDLSDYFGDITTQSQGRIQTEMGNEISDFYDALRP
ncbi:MAG: conjugal transfer protein TraN, partial [Nitrospiria bacterium]